MRKNIMKKIAFALMCLAVAAMFGCGANVTVAPTAAEAPSGEDMPAWVLEQPELCGVGIQKFRGNLGSAKTAAEAKGRDDLSRQLNVVVKNMIESYNAEGGTADGDFSEELTKNVSRQLSKNSISGSRPKKAHYSKADKQFYSLVCLEPGALAKAINGMKELDAAKRAALERRAKKAQEDMDAAFEKEGM